VPHFYRPLVGKLEIRYQGDTRPAQQFRTFLEKGGLSITGEENQRVDGVRGRAQARGLTSLLERQRPGVLVRPGRSRNEFHRVSRIRHDGDGDDNDDEDNESQNNQYHGLGPTKQTRHRSTVLCSRRARSPSFPGTRLFSLSST